MEQERERKLKAEPAPVSGWKRILMLAAAGFFFVLGAVGVVLPGLPTTPFLLLTSYFLVRAAPELNARLLESKTFGRVLSDWQVRRGVRRVVKMKAVCIVATLVSATLYFGDQPLFLKSVIVVLAAIGITVVLMLPNVDANESDS